MTPLRVIVMCKAPVTGKVKTRLISSSIDEEQACAWHREMAEVVIRRAARLFPDAVSIAADNPTHPFFAPFALPLLAQGEGDLGQRMVRIANRVIDHHPVLFLGTDSPHMDTTRLRQAEQLIGNHDAVVGPVEDGGYDLIALRDRKTLVLFDHIQWSSHRVWEQTQERARMAGLKLAALETGFDVDHTQELLRSRQLGWYR